jgi:large subunit ribosomal protein L18
MLVKEKARIKRKKRIRGKISGTANRPRLVVFKSATNIYAQAVDDTASKTIVSSSTLDKAIKEKAKSANNVDAAKMVGAEIAKKLLDKKIDTVVFDRNGYIYHGKVMALADAARENGLKF